MDNKLGFEVFWSDIRPYQNDDLDRVLIAIVISKNYNMYVLKPNEKIIKYTDMEEKNNEYVKYIRNRDIQAYLHSCNLNMYEGLEGNPSIMRIYYPNDNNIQIELRDFNQYV